ncbi:hypothetical protein BU25DRAFT_259623 [Macroventuria anomochaeta]|uniref:Uncharacterized protein n=1 Tax=Macroventuria anomochaeta TaxID=301207 RepID=A0ACB6S8G4_9PLEO|nr:uncharacterized protein BU25DRAFT_259623 [Macroventuria anomochaeta]KAF2630545.1 hypothetical protein BU25DRAFT_259623 [Macroventuria anomochaeta]
MADQSPDYKQLFLDEQRKRKDEQSRRQAAEHAYEQEQRKRENAEQAQKTAEEKTRDTTLPEFLDGCHVYLHSNLVIQTDANLSTRGDPANAKNKPRPERLRAWTDFASQQEEVWDDLMSSDFVTKQLFNSLHTLSGIGRGLQQRMLGSELDLHVFQRTTIDDPVSQIIREMHGDQSLRRKFGLCGGVKFENHANTLSPEDGIEESMQRLSVSGTQRRRSPRLQAKASPSAPSNLADTARNEKSQPARARADQFCVYNTGDNKRVAAFVMEYKAPHKIPLGYIYEGLDDMDLDDVVQGRENESSRDYFRRLMAAVITQAYSYMIQTGVEYGCVCTGEASIFLRVPHDPTTVYYFLSVAKGDVGDTTGWAQDSDGPNRLHLTAVGQMLAFTLQAMKTPPRSQKWRDDAFAQLKSWEVVFDELLDELPSDEAPSSEYRPPQDPSFLRMSPVRLRRRPARARSPDYANTRSRPDSSDEEPDVDTPSRQPVVGSQNLSYTQPAGKSTSSRKSRHTGQAGQYCTQKCLLGLVNGGPLDQLCPNVKEHGNDCHRIRVSTFLKRIRQQLSKDLDSNCELIGIHGACGVPFRVRLVSHGYTVVAKATPVYFVHCLEQEAAIYRQLRPIQGTHIPVCLGSIDMEVPYRYDGIAELEHMMFLSYGGKRLDKLQTGKDKLLIAQQLARSVEAIHSLGVLHTDLEPRNMLWDEDRRQLMVIDFERARVPQSRRVLTAITGNQKNTTKSSTDAAKVPEDGNMFVRERRHAANELHRLR